MCVCVTHARVCVCVRARGCVCVCARARVGVCVCVCFCFLLFPTFGVGLLDFKLNSSPRPELFSSPGLLLETPWSPCPNSETFRLSEVPNQRLLACSGVPNPRDSWVPNPRVSLDSQPLKSQPGVWSAPTPETPWSAQRHRLPEVSRKFWVPPQSLPGVPNCRGSLECPANPRDSVECQIRRWGCSK